MSHINFNIVFNIDFSKENSDPKMCNYLNDICSAGFCALINNVTKLTLKSSTTLNHIYSNNLNCACTSGVLMYDISDHLSVFCHN